VKCRSHEENPSRSVSAHLALRKALGWAHSYGRSHEDVIDDILAY